MLRSGRVAIVNPKVSRGSAIKTLAGPTPVIQSFEPRSPVATRLARWYLALSPAFPAPYYAKHMPLVRAKEEYEDELAGGFLKWFEHIDLRSKSVLDLGSGYGGRTLRYKELGARQAVGLEIALTAALDGRLFAESRSADVGFTTGVGESLPFADNSFDVVTSYDVFEHVQDLGRVLDECRRVLKPGGVLYAVFPPFYHPTGSHFEGYVSKMPYANVLFPCKTLVAAVDLVLAERGDGYRPHELRPGDKLSSLNGVTIRSFRKLLLSSHFSRRKVSYTQLFSPLNSRWGPWKMKYYAFLFRPLRWVPLLRELFVHRIVCQLYK
jgi:SAM-dependent methyltransferase